MARYAHFDTSKAAPYPVTSWFDTEFVSYPNLPAKVNLISVTDEQWAAHLMQPDGWSVGAGKLIAPGD